MLEKEIKCKNCGANINVTVWKEFVVCPYCGTKIKFEGFDYKNINRKASMYAKLKWEQDCPACRGKHMLSSSLLGKWTCVDCGYTLSGLKKVTGVLWFCDNCETYMNIQPGFTTKHKKWKCTECGYENDVSKKNIR